MGLIRAALRRPIATLVVVISVALCSVLAVTGCASISSLT